MTARAWETLAASQTGLLSDRQLRGLQVTRGEIRHHLKMRRWSRRSSEVLSTTTGPLSTEQSLWLGALHAGPTAMIGGLSALTWHGLRNWNRDQITVLVANPMSFEPLPGYRFFRTRRPRDLLIAPGTLPVARVEPAALLFASVEPNLRTALGAVTASVQQRLTTPESLAEWTIRLSPLRRARSLRQLLADVGAGAQSLAEVDFRRACRAHGLALPRSQRVRRDNRGRRRFTDNEWDLPDGTVLVLEIDGAFHDGVEQATDHRRRNRRLSGAGRTVIQCSAWEVRHEPIEIIRDLVALGVPRA